MLAFCLTIFTGAFLLFLVQPLIAKFILPWFGGGPAVWTTCMLFFQVLLLGGYAYAHLTMRRLPVRRQVLLHLALLAVALLLLPITPGDHWKPPDGTLPMGRILWLLLACLGLPYLVLSATGPLMQAWFSQAHPGVSPYRLYALSNVGSLLALLGYPFLVEPHFSRQMQAVSWSCGLFLFALLAGWCGWIVWRRASAPAAPAAPDTAEQPATPGRGRWLWFALPACGSALLLAVTNKLCYDIAVIPFLWVLPLSLYLLSFIVSFDSPRWYRRVFWMPALAFFLLIVMGITFSASVTAPPSLPRAFHWLHAQASGLSLYKIIVIYLAVLFVGCMVCHGEVYRLRPAAQHLTGYYLWIAAGGACGGLFVAGLAPLVFTDYFELHAGLFALGLLAAVALLWDRQSRINQGQWRWAWVPVGVGVLLLGACLWQHAVVSTRSSRSVTRNFYGVLRLQEHDADTESIHKITLAHGSITHGFQYLAPHKRKLPTTYYTPGSGVGLAMEHHPTRTGRRVGVVGLGTGTLAAWGKSGDYFRFYEINPEVQRLAHTRFSFLADSPARCEVISGDARLSLEREPSQQFDVLVLDAFSGDAIPAHLLTWEAFEIYRRHLRTNGIIAVHISNHYLDLEPVVMGVAKRAGWQTAIIHNNGGEWDDEGENFTDYYKSDWVLLTTNQEFLKLEAIRTAQTPPTKYGSAIPMWTDDESNLFRILIVEGDSWLGWLRRLLL